MDVRKVGHSWQYLCWLASWSPDACCGPIGLFWQSPVVAPGCRGTWRPWGQRWSTPQLKPGTGLAYCHPVGGITIRLYHSLFRRSPFTQSTVAIWNGSLTARASCMEHDNTFKVLPLLLLDIYNTCFDSHPFKLFGLVLSRQQLVLEGHLEGLTKLKGITLHTCLSAKQNKILLPSYTCRQVVTNTCMLCINTPCT